MQLLAFGDRRDAQTSRSTSRSTVPSVVYEDVNDPKDRDPDCR
jgi:hypothetical protein